jgi:mRNA guanylyltransferase
VCEKSDGLRVLFLICTLSAEDQSVYLVSFFLCDPPSLLTMAQIDRHNAYRTVTGFFFPHHQDPRMPLRSSLLDGELVIDVDKRSGQRKLRFLAFDCLAVDGEAIFNRPLDKRYGVCLYARSLRARTNSRGCRGCRCTFMNRTSA